MSGTHASAKQWGHWVCFSLESSSLVGKMYSSDPGKATMGTHGPVGPHLQVLSENWEWGLVNSELPLCLKQHDSG